MASTGKLHISSIKQLLDINSKQPQFLNPPLVIIQALDSTYNFHTYFSAFTGASVYTVKIKVRATLMAEIWYVRSSEARFICQFKAIVYIPDRVFKTPN